MRAEVRACALRARACASMRPSGVELKMRAPAEEELVLSLIAAAEVAPVHTSLVLVFERVDQDLRADTKNTAKNSTPLVELIL